MARPAFFWLHEGVQLLATLAIAYYTKLDAPDDGATRAEEP